MNKPDVMRPAVIAILGVCCLLNGSGCRSVVQYRKQADEVAARGIASGQRRVLGKTESVSLEDPADTLRRRLLLDQNLPHQGPESLGIRDLPDTEYWEQERHLDEPATNRPPWSTDRELRLSLLEALQVSARNSPEFQEAKEDLFRAALELDLQRDAFRSTFAGMLSGTYEREWSENAGSRSAEVSTEASADVAVQGATETPDTESDGDSVEFGLGSAEFGLTHKFLTGVELSSRIVLDLVTLMTQDKSSSMGIFGDASISIPLLRGAGRKIVGEPLKQAERNLLYAVHDFERFKRVFAVRVATEYLSVLQDFQQIRNAEENYKRLIAATRRARRLADAGRLPEFQYDQAVQDELRARTRWITARQSHAARLDSFKVLLGLPPDANIDVDFEELEKLGSVTNRIETGAVILSSSDEAVSVDALTSSSYSNVSGGGALEMDALRAVKIALDARLDLRTEREKVADAQRKVYIAADALRAEFTLLGKAAVGERHTSAASASREDAELRFDEGTYSGLLTLDLPVERTKERNAYRNSLIDLRRAVRSFQQLEDEIKLDIRNALRDLTEARETVLIQIQAVALARKRVDSTDLLLQAGRAEVRDVLESEEALLNAQNALTAAMVNYRTAELNLQRDLGKLEVTADGVWKEYNPGDDSDDTEKTPDNGADT